MELVVNDGLERYPKLILVCLLRCKHGLDYVCSDPGVVILLCQYIALSFGTWPRRHQVKAEQLNPIL